MYANIVVAIDIERRPRADAVLKAAQHHAKREQAKLHLVSVRADESGLTAFEFGEEVERLAESLRAKTGLEVGWRAIADDDVDEGLALMVEELEPDLVVIGAHEPTWLEIFTGPTVRDFVAACEASLLIVR